MNDRPLSPESGSPSPAGAVPRGTGGAHGTAGGHGAAGERDGGTGTIRTSPSGLPILPEEEMAPRPSGPVPGSRDEMLALRRNANWMNMVIATAICFAAVLVIVAVVPRSESGYERHVDAQAIAQDAQPQADFPLTVLDFGEGWYSNTAQYGPRGPEETPVWYQSVIVEEQHWVSIIQTDADAEPVLSEELDEAVQVEDAELAGWTWEVYERPRSSRVFYVNETGGVTTLLSTNGGESLAEDAASAVRRTAESG
ncbi:DUF4245 domain-containing protein [Sediminivirga luteola]|nr:DUF4245 domain-containing protein [Sediminivirga luteola]